jgi:hypothetical protein
MDMENIDQKVQATLDVLERIGPAEPRPGLWEKTQARLQKQDALLRFSPRTSWLLAAACALLLLANVAQWRQQLAQTQAQEQNAASAIAACYLDQNTLAP